MTDIDWAALGEPFPDNEVKQRPGPGGRTLSYVDARAVAQRLDDVVSPAGWNFTASIAAEGVVHGRLIVGDAVREDFGYPNSDDDAEPIKSATSDALKRCAVLFGIGRHLYDDNNNGHRPIQNAPQRPPLRAVASSPIAVAKTRHDDPYPDDLRDLNGIPATDPDGPSDNDDDTTCLEHNIPWIGSFGDRYHKKPEGGHCRTAPGNVAKPRR